LVKYCTSEKEHLFLMNLLILSLHYDEHAVIVASAMSLLGHNVVCWDSPDAAGDTLLSLNISIGGRDSISWKIGDKYYSNDYFDVIWFRRKRCPSIPMKIHADDRDFVLEENREFFSRFWCASDSKTRLIHAPHIADLGENKIKQLVLAKECDFNIPNTILSNDKKDIKKFIKNNLLNGHDTIYKTFKAAGWVEGDKMLLKHTTTVNAGQISKNILVKYVPGIYQQKIEKKYEVRANFFGDREISVIIDSQKSMNGIDDWRSIINLDGYIEQFKLPIDVYESSLQLMKKLGLSVGCFDFIVDNNDAYHFIEVNQQGQFLWIEQICDKCYLLDAFLDFIINGCISGVEVKNRDVIKYNNVLKSSRFKDLSNEFVKEKYFDTSKYSLVI